MPDKRKVFTYLMGQKEESGSGVKAIEVDVDRNSTVNDIVDLLYDASKLKTKDVWASLKNKEGTRLNEYATIEDLQNMIQEAGEDGIHLFIYNNVQISRSDLSQPSSPTEKQKPYPSVFRRVGQSEPNPEIQQIELEHSIQSNKQESLAAINTELFSAPQELIQNRPMKANKNQPIKPRSKDECCLLI